jgi:hypothetical protein
MRALASLDCELARGLPPEGTCDFVEMLPRSSEGTSREGGDPLAGSSPDWMRHFTAKVTRTRRQAAGVTGSQRPHRGAERGCRHVSRRGAWCSWLVRPGSMKAITSARIRTADAALAKRYPHYEPRSWRRTNTATKGASHAGQALEVQKPAGGGTRPLRAIVGPERPKP